MTLYETLSLGIQVGVFDRDFYFCGEVGMDFTWVFLETGRVKKKLTFVQCYKSGKKYIEHDRMTDLNTAYQCEKEGIRSGSHTYTNSVDDFLQGKLRRMDQKSFNTFLKGG
jgi:hypothetical protein